MARRITIGTTAALALAALIVAILALIDDPAPAPAPAAAPPPSKAEPSAYTHWFMQQALARYDAQGRQAALAFFNSPHSVDGQWYLFILEDGIAVGHPDQDVLGQDLRGDIGVDPTGYRFGDVILGVTDEGRWVDYVFRNLATGEDAVKHAWVVRHDGLIFGSGWYENTD